MSRTNEGRRKTKSEEIIMTFEKEFPSLKGRELMGDAYDSTTIKTFCLDKQKVKEAIKKAFINFPSVTKDECIREFEKEVNL